MRPPPMTQMERRGRIVLSLALLLLFFSVTASMIAGRFLLVLLVPCLVLALAGGVAMAVGRR